MNLQWKKRFYICSVIGKRVEKLRKWMIPTENYNKSREIVIFRAK